MPDVTIACPACAKTITVSEFVDLSQLVCRGCGSRFAAPGHDAPEGETLEEDTANEPVVTITPRPPVVVTAQVTAQPRRRFRWTYQIKCWVVFFCVGIVALVMRYGGILGRDSVETLIEYGPLVVLALHLYVTFRAFRESVVAGVLCLLVPFYSLYYAFWFFEDYMFRAIFAGILLGTGLDTLFVLRDNAGKILPAMDEFLNRGM
jgi:hypothetical protein